jgi:hypothetical protein
MRRNGGHGSQPGRTETGNRTGGAIRTSRVAADLQEGSTGDGACRDVADVRGWGFVWRIARW